MQAETRNRNREIMNDAWVIMRHFGLGKSDALKKAWLCARLRARLRKGDAVRFAFIKANGEYRSAYGMAAKVGAHLVNGTGNPPKAYNFEYWDLDRQMFRQFAKARIVCVIAADEETAAA